MVYIITAVVLIFGYVAAQDPDCDFYQDVEVNTTYYVYSPQYPGSYKPGQQCKHTAKCPEGYNCKVNCTLSMPSSPGYGDDRLLVFKGGNEQGPEVYCGSGRFSAVSTGRTIILELKTSQSRPGGRYNCELKAQRAPVTPPQ